MMLTSSPRRRDSSPIKNSASKSSRFLPRHLRRKQKPIRRKPPHPLSRPHRASRPHLPWEKNPPHLPPSQRPGQNRQPKSASSQPPLTAPPLPSAVTAP